MKKFTTFIKIKDCEDVYKIKEVNEKDLLLFFNLMNVFMHNENNKKTMKQENENDDKNELIDRNNIIMRETILEINNIVLDKDKHVKKHIDNKLKEIVFRLKTKLVACN